jgi:hypothetical protein
MTSVYSNKAIPRVENIKLSQEQIEEMDKLSDGTYKVGRKYIDQFVTKVERPKIKAIVGGFAAFVVQCPQKKLVMTKTEPS